MTQKQIRRVLSCCSMLALGFIAITLSATGTLAKSTRDPSDKVTVIRVPNGGIQPQSILDNKGVVHLIYFAVESARPGESM